MMPAKKTTTWLPGILNDFLGNEWIAKVNANAPSINIIESEKSYKVEIAAPGIAKDEFKIRIVDDNQLIISTERHSEEVHEPKEPKSDKYLRREFSYSQFQQTMILPDNVDKDAITATQENGVLVITIPKAEQPSNQKTKDIQVK